MLVVAVVVAVVIKKSRTKTSKSARRVRKPPLLALHFRCDTSGLLPVLYIIRRGKGKTLRRSLFVRPSVGLL